MISCDQSVCNILVAPLDQICADRLRRMSVLRVLHHQCMVEDWCKEDILVIAPMIQAHFDQADLMKTFLAIQQPVI